MKEPVWLTIDNVRYTASAFGGLPENNHSRGSVRLGIGPHPVADLWHVFQVLPRIRAGLGNPGGACGDQRGGAVAHARRAPQRLDTQMIAAHAVQHDHVEGRRGCPLLVEATYMKALRVRMPMHNLMDRALVAVEGEHDWSVGGEEIHELRRIHAVRVEFTWEQRHQIHD